MSDALEFETDFVLSKAELRRLDPPQQRILYPLLCTSISLQLAGMLVRSHVHGALSLPDFALAVLQLSLLAVIIVMWRGVRLARRGHITIDDDGLTGALDGRSFALPWREIASVSDLEDAFLFARRNPFGTRRIAIPKSALPDPGRFWTTLDSRLVAKRGLRARPGRRLIVNTART